MTSTGTGSTATEYVDKQVTAARGDDEDVWREVQTLYSRKLWHQLSRKLQQMLSSEMFTSGGMPDVCVIDNAYIVTLENTQKLDLLAYARMCLIIALQTESADESFSFLEQVLSRVSKSSLAQVCIITALAELQLQMNKMEDAKVKLKEAESLMADFSGVTAVHSDFYRVNAEYFKKLPVFHEFYTNSLRFLGCTELSNMSVEEQVARAFDLSLAAILGKGIYNFGELLAHPILESLRSTDKEWLIDLLYAFNSGDLSKFDFLKPQWAQIPDLAANEEIMSEKIRLLAFMEMVFQAPDNNRRLLFSDIATVAQIPIDQTFSIHIGAYIIYLIQGFVVATNTAFNRQHLPVELLVMKALSLGLVRGSMDQVDQVAILTWVQPRVLSLQQISRMADQFNRWSSKVEQVAKHVENQAPELFVQ
eukprot:gene7717-614_t